jgi:predicted RecA/RadA family phage recombinase
MPALTANRDTLARDGVTFSVPVAAAKKIYAGALVALDAAGNATPGAVATTLIGLGRAEALADNSTGAAGAISVEVRKGVFRFANSAAGDLITRAEIGDNAYIVDDQTVAKTDGGGTRSVAGKIVDVEAAGVWVSFA